MSKKKEEKLPHTRKGYAQINIGGIIATTEITERVVSAEQADSEWQELIEEKADMTKKEKLIEKQKYHVSKERKVK